jgi:general secretion pathway protein D
MIRNILAQLDKIPEQVMIETIIVEATLDSSSKLGVEWNIVNGNFLGNGGVTGEGGTGFGLQTTPPAQGFSYTVSGGNLGGFLNALQTDERFKVLSTPRIFTSNNVEAEINISQSVPFIVSQREDVNGNFIFNYSFQDVGIVLTVTPRITANGMVTLDVVQTANDLQGFTDFNAPIVNQRQAQTTVSVQDGSTIVLGGIMRSTVRTTTKKIPLLGDIPILGELFKSREKNEVKTELLVFLTPRVVRNPEQAEQLKNDQVGGLSKAAKDQYQKIRPPTTGAGTTTGGTTGGTTTGGSTTGGN